MKIEKSKFIILIILAILGIMPQAYAKTSIEIKPNTGVYTNKTISEFFDESMAMKNVGEGLEGSNVDVHMATNTDWAIFAYFSNSQYGTNGEGKNTGIDVTIGDKTYKSTNGNLTGMMNFGSMLTYTAGVISNYTNIVDTSATEEPYDWGKSIIENMKEYIEKHPNNPNNPHVDLINTVSANAIAATGWYGSWNRVGVRIGEPFSLRRGLFGLLSGAYDPSSRYYTPNGNATTQHTFRPVIWN